ncbi:MAG TPA: cyanophycinase [Saprospiraceae bacterium]|nr:cyanophycinase [Saprospiraceae bacterium]HMX82669.1 cyanophycinase [Saprospiraceae bacterium]HMX85166.1 cyanophycinase [Saprospiraceae bacterium]HMZ73410.1 cyanophycinase [Saprospiraceae bacterium]HNA40914.1 cyanophycinase [Saprospiraceae bacterium]
MAKPHPPKGTLIAVGGNEDKGIEQSEQYSLDFIEDGILSRIVKEAGGKDANISVVTTASSIPQQVAKNYLTAFGKLGCKNVNILDIRNKFDVKKADNINLIKKSDVVMLSGGDQRRLVHIIGGSEIHKILKQRYQEDDFIIAGTSAGAMAMSKEMISGGSSTTAMLKGNVSMMQGFGFLEEVIVDSHFINRGRFGRLTEAVAKFPKLLGIGLGEDTGVIIKEGNICTTIGSGMVLVFDGEHLSHNKVPDLDEGTPISIGNMIVHVMANTDTFYLGTRHLKILTADQAYEQEADWQ